MNDSLKAFLNSVAYHVGDVPLLSVEEADMTIDQWHAEGIDTPSNLTAEALYTYHQDAINERYPITSEPLDPDLDRIIYRFLSSEGYDFNAHDPGPITYVQAWFAVNNWRVDDPEVPDFFTPSAFMRWMNSHCGKRAYDKLWITYGKDGEEVWHGPYRTLIPRFIDADGTMVYMACDAYHDEFRVEVPVSHEVTTRDDL